MDSKGRAHVLVLAVEDAHAWHMTVWDALVLYIIM